MITRHYSLLRHHYKVTSSTRYASAANIICRSTVIFPRWHFSRFWCLIIYYITFLLSRSFQSYFVHLDTVNVLSVLLNVSAGWYMCFISSPFQCLPVIGFLTVVKHISKLTYHYYHHQHMHLSPCATIRTYWCKPSRQVASTTCSEHI